LASLPGSDQPTKRAGTGQVGAASRFHRTPAAGRARRPQSGYSRRLKAATAAALATLAVPIAQGWAAQRGSS